MATRQFKVGDIVDRIEDREEVRSKVLEISEDGESMLISYDEGGEGWWPCGKDSEPTCKLVIPPRTAA